MEYLDILLVMILLVLSVVLWALADFCDRVKNSKFKLIWLVPAAVCFVLMMTNGCDIGLIGAYAGTLVFAFGFFTDEKKRRRIISVISAACVLLTLPLCLGTDIYRKSDYTADFEKMFAEAKKRYVLTRHKGIDWETLYNKYHPQFEKVTKEKDEVGNYIVWNCFCAEFNDGHVGYGTDSDIEEKAARKAAGNDYGLVIMKLADGRFVALDVDTSLESKGIHQLTEITSWDGMPVTDADKKSLYYQMKGYADIDNEKFYEGVLAAGVGGDSVKVTFIDDEGNEQTAELPKLSDNYYERFENVLKTVNQSLPQANMEVTKINDTTAALRVCAMMYDSDSSKTENYDAMKMELKNDLFEMKEQGVKDIIIDIRGNSGGSGGMVMAIAELLAPEGEYFYASDPKWDKTTNCYVLDDKSNYVFDHEVTFKGADFLNDGKIIILVNSASVSAADHITKVMSQFDNVTIMGFTEPNGSAMGVSSIIGKYGAMYLSSSVLLDKDGSIFIDSGKDRQSGDDLDIRVPFDENAVHQLFDEKKDYLLEIAEEQLRK